MIIVEKHLVIPESSSEKLQKGLLSYSTISSPILLQSFSFNDLSMTIYDIIQVKHTDWTSTCHQHPWFELNYLTAGSMYTNIEGKEFFVPAGSFFLIPPKTMHYHRHSEENFDDGFCLRFNIEKNTPTDSVYV